MIRSHGGSADRRTPIRTRREQVLEAIARSHEKRGGVLRSIALLLVALSPATTAMAQDAAGAPPTATGALSPARATTEPPGYDQLVTVRTVKANGVNFRVLSAGAGENAVLLMHGFPMTSYAWRKVIPSLVQAGHAVVAPDLRGFGDTDRPATGYDSLTIAADMHGVMSALGHRRYHVVGHDVGGWHSYAVAATKPDAVRSLTVVSVPLPGFGLERAMDVSRGGSWHFGFHMNPDLPERMIAGQEREYVSWFFRNNGRVPGSVTAGDLDVYARSYNGPAAMRAVFSHYRALPQSARHNRELAARGKLAMPVLAVAGTGGEHPVPDLRGVAANARQVPLPGCGHFLAEECPRELAGALLSFFRGSGRPAVESQQRLTKP